MNKSTFHHHTFFNLISNQIRLEFDDGCMKEMNERNEEGGKGDCFDESVSLKK